MRHVFVGSALVAVFSSCGGDSLPMLCSVTSTQLGSNALTLRSDARLDRVGSGFVLFAADKDAVLAAPISLAGELGAVASVPVPVHTDGPWIGVVGTPDSPGGTLVVAYATNPSAGYADLMTFTVTMDGAAPTTPVSVGKIPAKGPSSSVVVSAGSGRGGEHMGITWGVKGTTSIFAKILGPDGRMLGTNDLSLGDVEDFDCLRFSPGKGDLTVTYVKTTGTPPEQRLFIQEIDASGAMGTSINFSLGTLAPGCAAVAPTMLGYGVAWKEIGTPSNPGYGDYFAAVEVSSSTISLFPYPVLPNARAAGGSAPPIVGVGTPGNKYTLLFAHGSGAEAWEVDNKGFKTAQPVTLPSVHGNTGTVSTQPVGSSLFATYADYASADPSNQSAGDRQFIELTCR